MPVTGSQYLQWRYEGVLDGRADARLGHQSRYAWIAYPSESDYHKAYSEGYRAGWIEQTQEKIDLANR